MIAKIKGKKVLFITTKRLDYMRNTQEIRMLQKHSDSYRIIGSTQKHYLPRLLKVYAKLFLTNVHSYDTVFIGFAPQLVLPLFFWKFRKKYCIIDFFVSIYDTFCNDRQLFTPAGLIGRFLHRLDCITIALADHVICDTRHHGDYFIEEFHANADKLQLLYLEADPSIYYPMIHPKPKELRNKHTVLFFGSMLPLQGYTIILDAFLALRNHPDYFFYFIGPADVSLKNKAGTSGNIQLIDWLDQKDLAYHISLADLCIAGHFNDTIQKAWRTIPGKAYIYRAMNKPMILGNTPANHELYCSDPNTIYVPLGDSDALCCAIRSFFGD